MKLSVTIIPNENILDVPIFDRVLLENEHHGLAVEEFSKKYNLGITAKSLGLKEGEYCGYKWQSKLASFGHIVFCVKGNFLIFFLPEQNCISVNQKNWMFQFLGSILLSSKKIGFMVVNNDNKIVEEHDVFAKTDNFKLLYNFIKNSSFELENVESERMII